MNHFGIGKLTRSGHLSLPTDLLRPLSIEKDVDVWAMYYPQTRLEEDPGYADKIDFVLSPIPYHLWAVTARITIHTKHDKHCYSEVSRYLANENVSILLSEASRSGHRYDTWGMIVAFDSALNQRTGEPIGKWDRDLKGYKKTLNLISNFESKFAQDCSEHLHIEKADHELNKACVISPVQSMAYFYHVSKTSNENKVQKHWHYHKPTKLRCDSNNELYSEEFRSIVTYINKNFDPIMPCDVFAESQPADMNIRAVMVPESRKGHHFGVNINFRRSGPPPTSKGFTSYVLDSLSDRLRVIGLNNQSILYSKGSEFGRLKLVVRDLDRRSDSSRKAELSQSICDETLPKELSTIDSVTVEVTPFSSIERASELQRDEPQKFVHDIFLSYARQDIDAAKKLAEILEENNIKVFMDEDLEDGSIFSDDLRTALKQSREFLIVASSNGKASEWVHREYAAAWALELTINVVTFRMQRNDLPDYLKQINAVPYDEIIESPDDWKLIQRLRPR